MKAVVCAKNEDIVCLEQIKALAVYEEQK